MHNCIVTILHSLCHKTLSFVFVTTICSSQVFVLYVFRECGIINLLQHNNRQQQHCYLRRGEGSSRYSKPHQRTLHYEDAVKRSTAAPELIKAQKPPKGKVIGFSFCKCNFLTFQSTKIPFFSLVYPICFMVSAT